MCLYPDKTRWQHRIPPKDVLAYKVVTRDHHSYWRDSYAKKWLLGVLHSVKSEDIQRDFKQFGTLHRGIHVYRTYEAAVDASDETTRIIAVRVNPKHWFGHNTREAVYSRAVRIPMPRRKK